MVVPEVVTVVVEVERDGAVHEVIEKGWGTGGVADDFATTCYAVSRPRG